MQTESFLDFFKRKNKINPFFIYDLVKDKPEFMEIVKNYNFPEPTIKDKLKFYGIKNYKIREDGETVDVNGGVDLSGKGLTKIPFKFGKVTGSFYCHQNHLTSLGGCPEVVLLSFWCSENYLTSLEFGPRTVGGEYSCSTNKLKTLEGSPKRIHSLFWCSNNKLTSLKGSPISVRDVFSCRNNLLVSLEGAPKEVGATFNVVGNPGNFSEEDVRKVCNVGGSIRV